MGYFEHAIPYFMLNADGTVTTIQVDFRLVMSSLYEHPRAKSFGHLNLEGIQVMATNKQVPRSPKANARGHGINFGEEHLKNEEQSRQRR